ncbi:uncharacterized protein LOC120112801 [Phoenix dactylifera]|uniref:Uncharacterized protein LOC120112801 n=1 Tax=Phoenix dactylifera TaxID=42345 RepID=A0A8B9AST5_PHODC|nr:uncharacterized protein LOC120112801 [Phoenix dactylifera]
MASTPTRSTTTTSSPTATWRRRLPLRPPPLPQTSKYSVPPPPPPSPILTEILPPPFPIPRTGAGGGAWGVAFVASPDGKRQRISPPGEERKPLAVAYDESRRIFQKLWTDADEITILQGFLEFTSQRGTTHANYQHDTGPFYDQIKSRLQLEFNKNQLVEKLRRLKKKYRNMVSRIAAGKEFVFKSPHDKATFEIASKIWSPSFKKTRNRDSCNAPNLQLQERSNLVPVQVAEDVRAELRSDDVDVSEKEIGWRGGAGDGGGRGYSGGLCPRGTADAMLIRSDPKCQSYRADSEELPLAFVQGTASICHWRAVCAGRGW